jgi:hypothetical protein
LLNEIRLSVVSHAVADADTQRGIRIGVVRFAGLSLSVLGLKVTLAKLFKLRVKVHERNFDLGVVGIDR